MVELLKNKINILKYKKYLFRLRFKMIKIKQSL